MIRRVDVCVYGGTPAGCAAAVAARQEGASVVLVEPNRWLGGILGAGIKPQQDCAMPEAVGGLTRRKVFGFGNTPPEIRTSFADWIRDEGIPVVLEHRVAAVQRQDGRIASVRFGGAPLDRWGVPAATFVDGSSVDIEARFFVDASYEGDLMAASGVSYRTGRESADEYKEEPAGVREPTNWTPIDPYVEPGRPESGLIPMIDTDHGKPIGAGDDYTQAYNFRFYLTTDPRRAVPLTPPPGYRASHYELVGRYAEYIMGTDDGTALERLSGIFPGWLQNGGEYNYLRESLVTNAPLGVSRHYQDGGWATRSAIWRMHIDYLRGLHHFLSTDPRIPADFREQTAALGLDRTMHPETEGWPNQLYVRVARRMHGRYTLTHDDVLNRTAVEDGVGLALYGVDTYPARRYACPRPGSSEVGVATEGNMFIGGEIGTGRPFDVPYRAITPWASDCLNLLVPVSLSATHIAYAAIRMEPTFCILGESAGVAAALAVQQASSVQDVNIDTLRSRLSDRGQILQCTT
ncbi:FAD-dependent oxidoreductase [Kribbella sp.]|uniref:FAD-dependent oxidoreductase n=1 Tax=Kribbella sp. TaxID=1871183 RepID=UPI002D35A401|nr:FAD-dependent oxidoreductase [Kribbella sp.]HZX08251.1 FAD-dependent oxidoreductase [Kribbella sp.]